MNKEPFTAADAETIDITDRAIGHLRDLGATIVDPGPKGALFQRCVDKYTPEWRNRLFIGQFPTIFPVNSSGAPTTRPHHDAAGHVLRSVARPPTAEGAPTFAIWAPALVTRETVGTTSTPTSESVAIPRSRASRT